MMLCARHTCTLKLILQCDEPTSKGSKVIQEPGSCPGLTLTFSPPIATVHHPSSSPGIPGSGPGPTWLTTTTSHSGFNQIPSSGGSIHPAKRRDLDGRVPNLPRLPECRDPEQLRCRKQKKNGTRHAPPRPVILH